MFDDLYKKYDVPGNRLDILVFMCLINLDMRAFNQIAKTYDLPSLTIPKSKLYKYDFWALFSDEFFDFLDELTPSVAETVSSLYEYYPRLCKYLVKIGQSILPREEWFFCPPLGEIIMITPCQKTECPGYTKYKASHCDIDEHRSIESIATALNITAGEARHHYEEAIQFLGSAESGLIQSILGIEPTLIPESITTDQPSPCIMLERKFLIPIRDLVQGVKKLHQTFQDQATSLGLDMKMYGEVLVFCGASTVEGTPRMFSGRPGRQLPGGVLDALSSPLWEEILLGNEPTEGTQEILQEVSKKLSRLLDKRVPI